MWLSNILTMSRAMMLIYLFGTFLPLISSKHVPFFRRDYTYIEDFDAHYKVHWDIDGLSWNSAFLACDDEGASLFYPKVKDEWTLVKSLIKDLVKHPNASDVFIGVHDKYNVGEFITVDGHPTESALFFDELNNTSEYIDGKCVFMDIETGVFTIQPCISKPNTPLPFVCKRIDDKPCPTIDREYKYIRSSSKCYKVNNRLKTWDEAMKTCYMEGGILAVLENNNEADILRETLRENLKSQSIYHVGIRRTISQGDFYSVKGTKFDVLYNRKWSDNRDFYDRYGNRIEPESDEQKQCGAIYFNDDVYTTTTRCDDYHHFICEMEARR